MINYVTGNTYTGNNAAILADIESAGFLTFMQAKSIGRVPAAGAGIELKRIVKVKQVDKKTGEKKMKKVPKRFWVFRIEDTKELEVAA